MTTVPARELKDCARIRVNGGQYTLDCEDTETDDGFVYANGPGGERFKRSANHPVEDEDEQLRARRSLVPGRRRTGGQRRSGMGSLCPAIR